MEDTTNPVGKKPVDREAVPAREEPTRSEVKEPAGPADPVFEPLILQDYPSPFSLLSPADPSQKARPQTPICEILRELFDKAKEIPPPAASLSKAPATAPEAAAGKNGGSPAGSETVGDSSATSEAVARKAEVSLVTIPKGEVPDTTTKAVADAADQSAGASVKRGDTAATPDTATEVTIESPVAPQLSATTTEAMAEKANEVSATTQESDVTDTTLKAVDETARESAVVDAVSATTQGSDVTDATLKAVDETARESPVVDGVPGTTQVSDMTDTISKVVIEAAPESAVAKGKDSAATSKAVTEAAVASPAAPRPTGKSAATPETSLTAQLSEVTDATPKATDKRVESPVKSAASHEAMASKKKKRHTKAVASDSPVVSAKGKVTEPKARTPTVSEEVPPLVGAGSAPTSPCSVRLRHLPVMDTAYRVTEGGVLVPSGQTDPLKLIQQSTRLVSEGVTAALAPFLAKIDALIEAVTAATRSTESQNEELHTLNRRLKQEQQENTPKDTLKDTPKKRTSSHGRDEGKSRKRDRSPEECGEKKKKKRKA